MANLGEIDLGSLPQWGSLFIAVLGAGGAVWAYLTKRAHDVEQKAETEAAKVLKTAMANKERLDRHETRLTSIETALRHLPSAEAVHELRIGQERLQGDLKVVMERVVPIGEIARRMQDVMISEGRR